MVNNAPTIKILTFIFKNTICKRYTSIRIDYLKCLIAVKVVIVKVNIIVKAYSIKISIPMFENSNRALSRINYYNIKCLLTNYFLSLRVLFATIRPLTINFGGPAKSKILRDEYSNRREIDY